MSKKPRPDLVDNCPNCGISFQKPNTREKEAVYGWIANQDRQSWEVWKPKKVWGDTGKKEWATYSHCPVMLSQMPDYSGLACTNCGIHEGREVVQESHYDRGFFKNDRIPAQFGSRVWVLKAKENRSK